jgi:nitroreductase
MELMKAIKERRSIRKYTGDPVDDKTIETILEAGRWAPSWSNTQCWRFIVVRDPAIKTKLAESLIKFKISGELVENPGIKMVNTVPVVIVVCAEMGKSGGNPGSGGANGEFITDKGDWFMFDTALAVQNMVLAAHDLGLGTVIIGTFDAKKAEKVLDVPEGFRVVTLFSVGVPAQQGKTPPRKEISEITYYNRWKI